MTLLDVVKWLVTTPVIDMVLWVGAGIAALLALRTIAYYVNGRRWHD